MSQEREQLTFEFPDMQPNQRLRELILHIAKAFEYNPKFGKTKLVKILYYSDFTSYRLTGKPITGVKYVKLPNGPMPDNLSRLLSDMASDGDIEIRELAIQGYENPQMRVVPKREVDYSLFSAQEIANVDTIIRDYWDWTGSGLAKSTHGVAWEVLGLQEPIPYEAAILSDEEITQDDIEGAEELIRQYGSKL